MKHTDDELADLFFQPPESVSILLLAARARHFPTWGSADAFFIWKNMEV